MSAARTSPGSVDAGGVYNYVPSVMRDGLYRMWWCGSDAAHPGDHIFYAESSSLDGPFHARGSNAPYQVVFSPTGGATFDGQHTCDPSVLRVNGIYYLYCGGLRGPGASTGIGVATSADGINWTRANGGAPIVTPAYRQDTGNGYGAGQPAVSYLDGRFYLMYTDTTGAASSPKNGQGFPEGAGQYLLRSADPGFQSGVEELTADGFQPRTAANHTAYNGIGNYYSVDLQYSDALDSWIVAHSDGPDSRLTFLSPDFSSRTFADVAMPRSVVEGPGLVSRPDRHAVAPVGGRCGVVPVDIVNAAASPVAPTGLAHAGVDVSAGRSCASMAPGQVARVFEGSGIQVPGLPPAFIDGGLRLQSAGLPPIQDVTRNFVVTTPEVSYSIPYGDSLFVGQTVVGAPGRPAAFLLDNSTKWPISALKIITDNGSTITMVGTAQYDAYPSGPALYLVQ
ncbi:hypothetical protein [Kitasatospora sp. NPDC087315]|uniref:hypothetical protein n=1 Tax=Kitasatospora sp. NPDC087315 TaxID=3364069 RepID=UPI0037FB7DBF